MPYILYTKTNQMFILHYNDKVKTNPLFSQITLSEIEPVNSSEIKITEPLESHPTSPFKVVLD